MKILLVGGFGYIGSYVGKRLSEDGYDFDVSDRGDRGNLTGRSATYAAYQEMNSAQLAKYTHVLWFAGHSSVARSIEDPNGAIDNNCMQLMDFARRLPASTKFIYASSASLYSTKGASNSDSDENSLTTIPEQNSYDISKFAFDYIAKNFLPNFCGLRMGTLCGYSDNMREELVFNSMN
ncbi:MAG: NAD-dependent epimerase/dehydratase family protein, partial [Gammaproteobacteria bacterium]|nr:NAD-dependent epimerase/dehydratase family protein [Gammaproteobacteria bacterium]